MNATTHAVIGSLIVVLVKKPEIALPLAFVSHFIADTIPHFGYPGHEGFGPALKKRFGRWVGVTDPILLVGLFVLLLWLNAGWTVFAGALLADSPDLEWLMAFWFYERHGKKPPRSPIAHFHEVIQWYEKPWGYATEVIITVPGVYLLIRLLR